MWEVGSPRFGMVIANFTCGGTITVGSTASLGCSLRTTTVGGASCSIEVLGIFPFRACSLSRSPPPPPPPAAVLEGWSGRSSEGAIRVVTTGG